MAIETFMLEGFEQYSVVGNEMDSAQGKWYATYNTGNGVARSGSKALSSPENSYSTFATRTGVRMLVFGFGIYFTTERASDCERFISIAGGPLLSSETQMEVEWDVSGVIKVYRGTAATGTLLATGTTTLQTGTWYYMEMRVYIDNTNGEYEFRIDGNTEVSGSTVDTQGSASYDYANKVVWRCDNSSAAIGDFYLDDVYVRGDPTTNTSGGWFGPITVKMYKPNANGTTRNWTPSTGTDDYAVVDETTYSSTDYLYDDTDGNQVTMGFENCTSGATIKSVILNNYSHISTGGGRNMIPLCRSNSTVYSGTTRRVLQVGYEVYEPYDVDPATSSAWTETNFNAAEFGVETD